RAAQQGALLGRNLPAGAHPPDGRRGRRRGSMRRTVGSIAAAAILLVSTRALPALDADEPAGYRVAVRAAHLIDGRGGPPLSPAVVLVEGDRIRAVGARLAIPPGYPVIDLGQATLLPGLIDCHTHITMGDPGDYYEKIFRRSAIDYAVAAPIYARRTLEAGFTMVRDVGAEEFIDVALRKAIDSGLVPGPRMHVATL